MQAKLFHSYSFLWHLGRLWWVNKELRDRLAGPVVCTSKMDCTSIMFSFRIFHHQNNWVTTLCASQRLHEAWFRGSQIPGARSSWRLNYVRWHLIFVYPPYGTCFVPDFKHPPICTRDFRSSGMFRSVHWWLLTDVSGPPIHVIFKGETVPWLFRNFDN
jgi:hypothetical protein